MQQLSSENIPDSFLEKWQEIANLLANIMNIPAALIMKYEKEMMEVFTSSKTDNNPYKIGDKENWDGLYCQTVIKSQKKLNIPNALKDKDWDENPDIKLGMIAYLGFPINFPDKTPFGTICVLDSKERSFSAQDEKLLNQFKNTIELDLALISGLELRKSSNQKDIIQDLLRSNEEYLTTNEELQQTNEELLHAKQRAEKSEGKLRKKNDLLEKVFHSNFDLIALSDLKGNFTLIGKSHEILGYDTDYLIGKNVLDFVHPDDVEFVTQEFARFIQSGENRKVEYRYKCKNGDYLWFETIGTVLKDTNGKPEQILFNTRDITDRKFTDEALRESETRFQKMLAVVPDLVSIHNPEMDILYSNWQGFGAVDKRKRILNTKCYKTYRNLDYICPDCRAKTVFETRKPVQEEAQLPNGKWYDIRVIPILDEHNNVEMFMEWVRDITESKQSEENLRSNYALLEIAGETARFGGWSVDLEKNIATWSDAVADIHEVPHGYAPPVQDAISFYAPAWRDKITRVFNDCAQKGIPYDEEMEIITSKGKRRWVRASGRAEKDKTGKIVKVQGAFQDITQYKKTEEALKSSADKLKHWHELLNYIIKHNRSAVAVHDRNLNYIYVSQRYLDVFNVEDPDIIGKHHYEVFPDLPQKWREVHQKALAGEVHSAEEDPFYREDGSTEWTRWECRPWYEADGSIGGIIVYTEVITDRKQKEQLLTEQKDLLSAIYRNAPLVMMVVDAERRVQQVNGFATQFAGKDAEEMLGLRGGEALRCMHALDDPKGCGFGKFCQQCVIRNSVLDTLETGKSHIQVEAPYFFKGKDNEIREMSFLTSTTAIKIKGERMVLITLQDITDRKRAEEALKESEERFRYVLRDIPWIAVQGYRFDGTVIYWNKASENLYGYKAEEAMGDSMYELIIPPEMREIVHGEVKQMHETLKPVPSAELSLMRKNGSRVSVISSHAIVQRKGHEPELFCLDIDITNRKKVEDALKKSEIKFRQLFEQAAIGIFISDSRHNIIDVNEKALSVLGYSREQMININAKNIVHPDDIHENPLDENVRTMLSGKVLQIERRYCRKDGKYINALINMGKIDTEESKNLHMVMFQDITDRKKAEMITRLQYNISQATITTKNLNELFESIQHELNSIIDAKNFVIAFYNNETGMLSANVEKDEKDEIPSWPAKKSLTGYVIKENRTVLLQKNEILRLHEEGIIDIIGTTAESWLGVPLKVEERILGAVVIQNYHKPGVYDQTSTEIMELVAHELSMFIDRQRSEEEVNKLSRAVEQSSVSVVITNREGAIEYVNPFFTELTGYSFEEAMGKNPNILQSGHHSTFFYKELWDTILSGKNWEGEILNKKKNGELYWEKAVISSIENNEGIVTNFVAIKEDITGQKEAEKLLQERNERIKAQNKDYEAVNEELRQTNEELYEAKEKAEESDRLKTAFLQNMSHEIRTPLNAISGFSAMLNRPKLPDEKRQKFVSIIQNSSRQLVAIISDILTISSLDTQQEKLNISKVRIDDVIEELLSIFEPEAKKQNISLKATTALTDNQELVYTDKTKITQIFTNLLSNALKFTHEGFVEMGYSVKKHSEPAEMEFYVKDTGIGMTPDQQKIIFDRFQQAHKSINKLYGGTGLGLSISKGFTEMMGGKIWVESLPEKGSTFYFTIPYKPV